MLPYKKRDTPSHAVILSEAARDSASAFASRFFAEILRGAALQTNIPRASSSNEVKDLAG